MSYLLHHRYIRIIAEGLEGCEQIIKNAKPTGLSKKIQDYMHLDEYNSVINKSKSLNEVIQINPVKLLGFTEENQYTILNALVSGLKINDALDLARVKKSAFETWEILADKNIEPYASFISECKAATAALKLSLIQGMTLGGWKGKESAYKAIFEDPESLAKMNTPTVNINQNVNILDMKPDAKREYLKNIEIIDIDPKDLEIKEE